MKSLGYRLYFLSGAILIALTPATLGAEPLRAAEETRSGASAPVATAAQDLFQRVVLLGASVTSGFSSAEPFGGPKTPQYQFANFLEAALAVPHQPIVTHANRLLFLNPKEIMQRQVAATVSLKPTLVVGLDALFWFCYGAGMTAEQRLERFNSGLELLEQIDAPLILGDVPDASAAVGKILSKAQLPELSTIAECNRRLRTWAAARNKVTLFPLSEVLAKSGANEELTFAGIRWPPGTTRGFLQADRLHPSRHGLAALAIATLDSAAIAAGFSLPDTGVLRNPDKVYAQGITLGAGTKNESAGRDRALKQEQQTN